MRSKTTAMLATGVIGLVWIALSGGPAQSSTDPGPKDIRSIDIRNECPSPVLIYYGRAAPVRPELAVTLNAHASTTQPMLEGTTVWLVDRASEVLGNASVAPMTRSIVVDRSCTHIEARDR